MNTNSNKNSNKNSKTIIENEEYRIVQDTKRENLYTIEFFKQSKPLIKSIIKTRIMLPSDDYKSLYINATSVETLEQYQTKLKKQKNTTKFSYNTVLNLIETLSRQLNYLINFEYKSFHAYNTENIIVINETIFVYLSNELLDINPDKETIEITYPYPKNSNTFYISPELFNLDTIPSDVHYKTIYYSLSALAINQLQNQDNKNLDNKNLDNQDQNYILESIKNTKLYFLLKRCLDEDINRRSIIFI